MITDRHNCPSDDAFQKKNDTSRVPTASFGEVEEAEVEMRLRLGENTSVEDKCEVLVENFLLAISGGTILVK
ncbi:unnamed protein product [Nippostrongylus brasiliensis]|uniref:Uncharacterized protein n=1 Tax=Nippostrongylus brasiliensis TaxID=27835 RepID=A0A0N4YE76_NIPBR|nr:unnamed protein product [Nippostrongylus brasiliensis]